MLYELVEDAGNVEPGALTDAYLDALASVVEAVGVDRVVAESGVDEGTVTALVSGEQPELSLSEATAILAVDDAYPDADTVLRETLDEILLGMTTGVLDVDSVAANIELDVSPKGVQQRIEGRTPMTLREYAHVKQFVASSQR